ISRSLTSPSELTRLALRVRKGRSLSNTRSTPSRARPSDMHAAYHQQETVSLVPHPWRQVSQSRLGTIADAHSQDAEICAPSRGERRKTHRARNRQDRAPPAAAL